MNALIAIALLLNQDTAQSIDMGYGEKYSYREMAQYTVQPPIVNPSCVRKFMRMKVPNASLDLLLDLDNNGTVINAVLGKSSEDQNLDFCVLDWVKHVQFKDDSPRHGVYVSNFINARLTPAPKPYEQFNGNEAATVYNWSKLAFCKLTGVPGPNNTKACKASILLIDLKRAKLFASENRISSGPHKITLSCDTQGFANLGSINFRSFAQTYSFNLQPNAKYRLEPRWEGTQCSVDIIDSATGSPLAKEP